MTRGRLTGVRWIGAALLLAAVALPAARAVEILQSPAEPSDALWTAIVYEESGGDSTAYNTLEQAAGVVQIRPVCLNDINRIARIKRLETRFALPDRFDPDKARRMWDLYLSYYGHEYERETGRPPTDEVYARIWNGGPYGWQKDSSLDYWNRVRAAMN